MERVQMFELRRRMTIPPLIDRIEVMAAFESGLLAAEARWPEAPVNAEEFVAYARERVGLQRELSAMLPRFRVDDLFLAWWAMTSVDGLVAFECELADDLHQLFVHFPHVEVGDLVLALRETLFGGDEPRIAEFSGFGSLRSWVMVVASRTFLDVARTLK
jgi:hypothetical protein